MELFTQLFGDLLAFVYHCFDRIVIYGYLSGLSRPEQVVHFFRQIVGVSEVRYIQRRAADHDSRILTIGQLVLFSTETGDAWLLDPADQLAARLARDGQSEPIHIEETDTTFAIGWKGRYRIDGRPSFTPITIPAG